MNEKLKPCPFCGEEDNLTMSSGEGMYWMECESCGARGPVEYARKTARKNWNEGVSRK